MLPLMSSLTSYPGAIPNGYTNQTSGTIHGRGSFSFAKHEAVELEVYPMVPNAYQDAVLFSGTTFLPGPMSTDSSKGLPTPDSIRTKTHKMVLESGGTGS